MKRQRPPDRLAQGDGDLQAEFAFRAGDVGQVDILRALRLGRLDVDPHILARLRGDGAREVARADDLVRTNVVGRARLTAHEEGGEPDDEIGRVQIGAQRRPVPAHRDGAAAQGVADEIARGEILVERQVGTEKGEGAGGGKIDARFRAEQLGFALWRRSLWSGDALTGGVFLVDSIGELASIYSLATVAFVPCICAVAWSTLVCVVARGSTARWRR